MRNRLENSHQTEGAAVTASGHHDTRHHPHHEQNEHTFDVRRWLVPAAIVLLLILGGVAFAVYRASIMPPTSLYAFYVDWDSSSYLSLSQHIDEISTLVPEWYHLAPGGALSEDSPDAEAKALALIKQKRPDLRITPLVNDLDKSTGEWDAAAVAKMIHDPQLREKIADEIVSAVHTAGYQGVNIDFEGLPAESRDDLVAFMGTLHDLARKQGLEVTQCIAVGDPAFDLPALANNVDYLVAMMYDQHTTSGDAGPIAAQDWYEGGVTGLLKQVPASKVIVAFGDYSYEWRAATKKTRATTKTLSYAQAVASAKAVKTTIDLDPASLNPTYKRTGRTGWLLDAVTAFNEIAFGRGYPLHGFALWRIGGADPALWPILHQRDSLDEKVAHSLNTPQRSVSYDAKLKRITAEKVTP